MQSECLLRRREREQDSRRFLSRMITAAIFCHAHLGAALRAQRHCAAGEQLDQFCVQHCFVRLLLSWTWEDHSSPIHRSVIAKAPWPVLDKLTDNHRPPSLIAPSLRSVDALSLAHSLSPSTLHLYSPSRSLPIPLTHSLLPVQSGKSSASLRRSVTFPNAKLLHGPSKFLAPLANLSGLNTCCRFPTPRWHQTQRCRWLLITQIMA